MASSHEEECYANNIFTYFFVCKGPSNDVVGVAMGTVFQKKISPRAGFKTGDFVTEKLGGLPFNDSLGTRQQPREKKNHPFRTILG